MTACISIKISKVEADRIAREARAEYQRLVDACNSITDDDIQDAELRRIFRSRQAGVHHGV